MKHILVALMILSLLVAKTPSYASAAPLAAQGTQPSESVSKDDDYISLRWIVYMMILSLPFSPSETKYQPINIPVSIPPFRLPMPTASQPRMSLPKVKTPQLIVPKLKEPRS